MNARCQNAIAAKNSAEGHASFKDQREKCAGVLAEEHQKYVATLKEKIGKLKKGSKQYWRLNRELLCKKGRCSSIPPLRDGTLWVNSSKDKANVFAKTFAGKAVLPDESVDWRFLVGLIPSLMNLLPCPPDTFRNSSRNLTKQKLPGLIASLQRS